MSSNISVAYRRRFTCQCQFFVAEVEFTFYGIGSWRVLRYLISYEGVQVVISSHKIPFIVEGLRYSRSLEFTVLRFAIGLNPRFFKGIQSSHAFYRHAEVLPAV